jgi:hypothetical protein
VPNIANCFLLGKIFSPTKDFAAEFPPWYWVWRVVEMLPLPPPLGGSLMGVEQVIMRWPGLVREGMILRGGLWLLKVLLNVKRMKSDNPGRHR